MQVVLYLNYWAGFTHLIQWSMLKPHWSSWLKPNLGQCTAEHVHPWFALSNMVWCPTWLTLNLVRLVEQGWCPTWLVMTNMVRDQHCFTFNMVHVQHGQAWPTWLTVLNMVDCVEYGWRCWTFYRYGLPCLTRFWPCSTCHLVFLMVDRSRWHDNLSTG